MRSSGRSSSRPGPPGGVAAGAARGGSAASLGRGGSAASLGRGGSAATRRRLLAAAGERFAARGFRGATLREIAERAGTNLAAANYHFGSKRGLYLEVAREHFEALEHRLAAQGAAVGGEEDLAGCSRGEVEALLRARLRTILRSFLEDDRIHASLMQRELLDPSDALQMIVRRWVLPLRGAIERILVRLAPELAPAERTRASFSTVGQLAFYLTHRPALLLMMERRAWPRGFVDEVAEHVTEFTLGGIERLRSRRRARRRR
ncbi:MAG: CerR family C-terminal domain-containing protein [Deltaproteobacteria bacterium]|nr:CerR family C-terminal domain-containing protein [Deltaproteobacteria bacterium]